ncbi:MAG: alpha/beta fold hydrolase [Candidatus Geothermincolia bacterium]
MPPLRKHGSPPFDVAVLHGGPGAAGEVAPVAEHISASHGALEPFQTATTVDGQVHELASVLSEHACLPVTLVGYSWGAMLALVFAARNPSFVRKLVLVSSASLDAGSAAVITATRLERMSPDQRLLLDTLVSELGDPLSPDRNAAFARLGELISRVDSFDPIPCDETVQYDYDIFTSVWSEAEDMRNRGEFVTLARAVECPVAAIHGDYDPHPSAGVVEPLSGAIPAFEFILLPDCGHKPWAERRARGPFFEILGREVG